MVRSHPIFPLWSDTVGLNPEFHDPQPSIIYMVKAAAGSVLQVRIGNLYTIYL